VFAEVLALNALLARSGENTATSSEALRPATMPQAYRGSDEAALQGRRHSIQSARPRGLKTRRRDAPKTASLSAPIQDAEVARLTRELNEASERQTATSEVLRVISNSPADLQPVFEAMLDNAVRICDVMGGSICRWDGNALHHVALRWINPAFTELLVRTPIHPNPKTNVGRMLATKKAVHVPDLAAQPAYIEQREPGIVAAVEIGRVRTALYVPMLKECELIGAILLARGEVRPFSDKQIALVKNFGAQAVIAIENARLFNELRQRTTDLTEALEQQTATSEVLQTISKSPGELQPVFHTMLANAVQICDANFGNLLLFEDGAFRTVALHGAPQPYLQERQREPVIQPKPGSDLDQLLKTKQAVHVPDIQREWQVAARLSNSRVLAPY
jgi:hypothetical protein